MKEIKITEAQKNSISSVLLILDETMDEIEELCISKDKKGILYDVVNNLSENEKGRVVEDINRIREIIREIAKGINIKKKRYETKRLISSRIASLWEMIYEIESNRLKGYGDVSKSLKEYLDPEVDKIIHLLNDIEGVLYKK
jgi:hypothetical protein